MPRKSSSQSSAPKTAERVAYIVVDKDGDEHERFDVNTERVAYEKALADAARKMSLNNGGEYGPYRVVREVRTEVGRT